MRFRRKIGRKPYWNDRRRGRVEHLVRHAEFLHKKEEEIIRLIMATDGVILLAYGYNMHYLINNRNLLLAASNIASYCSVSLIIAIIAYGVHCLQYLCLYDLRKVATKRSFDDNARKSLRDADVAMTFFGILLASSIAFLGVAILISAVDLKNAILYENIKPSPAHLLPLLHFV